jgi:hypothetical protein
VVIGWQPWQYLGIWGGGSSCSDQRPLACGVALCAGLWCGPMCWPVVWPYVLACGVAGAWGFVVWLLLLPYALALFYAVAVVAW